MDDRIETALRYRQRADELRIVAATLADQKSREVLLGIANDYERMASQLEQVEDRLP